MSFLLQSRDTPDVWKHDMFDGDVGTIKRGGVGGGGATGKLHIDNLDFGVNEIHNEIMSDMKQDELN